MAEFYYQKKLYSNDEVKNQYVRVIKSKDQRAIDQGFVEYITTANLRIRRKCYMNVHLTCDKQVTVHYSAHKKVEETTGYTVTRRVDAMNLVDYKVDENTKTVTYTDSNDYSKNFYGVSDVITECVSDNFMYDGGSNASIGYSTERHEAYAIITPWSGITQKLKTELESSSGCSSEVSDCRSDILDSAKKTGYTLDSCTLKSASVSNIVVEKIEYFVKYFIDVIYDGNNYSCEFGKHGEMLESTVSCPESKELKEIVERGTKEANQIKAKAKCVTVPTSIINVAGILASIVFIFKFGFSEALGMVIASLVFNIGYWGWISGKFDKVDKEVDELKNKLQRREFVEGIYIPEILGAGLIVASVLLTLWNVMVIVATFVSF